MELDGVFEEGEYGFRGGREPRRWHREFAIKREEMIAQSTGKQSIVSLCAGTGAGKTDACAMAASDSLAQGRVRRIVVGVPTKLIARQTQRSFRENFGIHLALFDMRKHRHGVTSDKQGYIFLYPGLTSHAAAHRRIARYEPTLAIFDEVHHLGDAEGESWGQAAQLAFGDVPEILALTGSPFRPKGSFIPFVNYVPTDNPSVLRFVADYSCTLGRCIVEGYCREPDFRFSDDGIVEIRPAGSSRSYTVSFAEKVNDSVASLRLAAAVKYGSPIRRTLLRDSLAEIRADRRKCIIFLGGDTNENGTPTEDATTLLPSELNELGYRPDEYMAITMADKNPDEKLKKFRESKTAWILTTVNMVSEGADAPEISAAIFLTTWVSSLSFIQRVGRALRFMGKGDPADAWFYLLHHPSYRRDALAIKREMEAEAILLKKRQREESSGREGGPPYRTEAAAISGGEITYRVWNGEAYPSHFFAAAERECERLNISRAYLDDILKKMREAS